MMQVSVFLTLCNATDCIAHQAPLSMEFSRQEYSSGLPFPIPGDLPDPGVEPCHLSLLRWQADSLPLRCLVSFRWAFRVSCVFKNQKTTPSEFQASKFLMKGIYLK